MRLPWEPAKDDLETRVKRLETELISLKLEWSEVMDKLLHRLQRQSKRDRDAAVRALESAPTAQPGPPDSPALQGRSERLAAARARLLTRGRGNGWPAHETGPGTPKDGSIPG